MNKTKSEMIDLLIDAKASLKVISEKCENKVYKEWAKEDYVKLSKVMDFVSHSDSY